MRSSVQIEEARIVNNKLLLPKSLLRRLKWRFPFYSIPRLKDYSKSIIDFSKVNSRLPFYVKFDINNDGKDEIIIVQKSIFGGYGRLLIISTSNDKIEFNKIRWERPVNSMYFDYLIDVVEPREYQTTGFIGMETFEPNGMKSKVVSVKYPHLITRGYLNRIVFWDGDKYCQEKVPSALHDSGK